jgi:hypothetical protein
MKHIFLSSALVAVLGFALASAPVTAQAQSTNAAPSAPTAPAKAKAKAAKNQYKGTITAIDASSITVKTASSSLTLAVASTTLFQFGTAKKNTPATAADFAVNDAVTGSYTKAADGTMTAVTVRKKAAK